MTEIQKLRQLLDDIGNRLVPVAGLLMYVTTSNGRCAREPEEHYVGCDCAVCNSLNIVQDIITKCDAVVKEIE